MLRLCLLVCVASLVAAAAGEAARAQRPNRGDVPAPTIFAPPPPDYEDLLVPPPTPEESLDLDVEARPPLPPIAPPPPPPPPAPPQPELSHVVFSVSSDPSRGEPPYEPATKDEVAPDAAPAIPAPLAPAPPAPAPAPRQAFTPFAEYGPPSRALPSGSRADEALREGLETSSDWGAPGALAQSLSRGGAIRRDPYQPQRGAQLDDNQEFSEISSDWGVPGSHAHSLSRGGAIRRDPYQPQRVAQLDDNQEFSEISSDWGVPGASQSDEEEEPLFEYNEISSDWSFPSSVIPATPRKGGPGGLAQARRRHRKHHHRRPQHGAMSHHSMPPSKQQTAMPQPPATQTQRLAGQQPLALRQAQPQLLTTQQATRNLLDQQQQALLLAQQQQAQRLAQQQQNQQQEALRLAQQQQALRLSQQQQSKQQEALRLAQQQQQQQALRLAQQQQQQQAQGDQIEGRYVYSHLVGGRLFNDGPHRDSPLDLATSSAVRLLHGSFNFVSPEGIPVNIRKIRFHSPPSPAAPQTDARRG